MCGARYEPGDFDQIAVQYGVLDIGGIPVRRYSQVPTLLRLAGDLAGLSVLEVGCSDGFFSRALKSAGAASVLGVDLCDGMVALARAHEARRTLGIEYLVRDAFALGVLGRFDLLVSSFLLHYATSREDLLRLCRILHANLKPGGRLISLCDHPDAPPDSVSGFEKYGETKRISTPVRDGATITVTFLVDDASGHERRVAFDCTYFTRETFTWALETAGFREIVFHEPQVSADGVEAFGRAFWARFLEHPLHAYIECRR